MVGKNERKNFWATTQEAGIVGYCLLCHGSIDKNQETTEAPTKGTVHTKCWVSRVL